MNIGCIFPPTIDTPDHIAVAEGLGYEYAYVYDSPSFLADAWMTLARAAERTSTIKIGVSVITPRLRHLIANAGAVATLATLAPGRTEVVVGSGFTSQLMLGEGPLRWAEVEDYVNGLRSLLRGEDVEWGGATIGLRHGDLSGVRIPAEVPIRVAAHGPKGYAVAARAADGMVTNLDHHSANTGAASMDKALVTYFGTVLDKGEALDCDRVIDATGPAAAFQLHIGVQGLVGGTAEAKAYEAHLASFPEGARHLETHRGHLIEVTEAERPLITPALIESATGTGTSDEVAAALSQIAASGVQGVLYGPMGPDIPRELEAFARCAGIGAAAGEAKAGAAA
ncbi:MAG: LLM class flavin-dependent oxidoreductase [Actinobacteria bacterium]|nr:LLM class flavin-dependent oxidoreductase [Actinomycetota bacterium]